MVPRQEVLRSRLTPQLAGLGLFIRGPSWHFRLLTRTQTNSISWFVVRVLVDASVERKKKTKKALLKLGFEAGSRLREKTAALGCAVVYVRQLSPTERGG